jgi:hypothetical protein
MALCCGFLSANRTNTQANRYTSGLSFKPASRDWQVQPSCAVSWVERLSEDLPIVVEIIDTKEKLERFLDLIDPHIKAGMVTLEKAEIKFYRAAQN